MGSTLLAVNTMPLFIAIFVGETGANYHLLLLLCEYFMYGNNTDANVSDNIEL
jgi:hypothetical protein